MNFLHLKNGLREIADNYKIFSIDLWGVVHDGVSLNPRAMEVLDNLKKNKKSYFHIINLFGNKLISIISLLNSLLQHFFFIS